MIDSFSKFAAIRLLKAKTAKEVGLLIKEIFYFIGPPKKLHSDNGKEFKNKILRDICDEFHTIQIFGRARAPWIQGQV